MQKSMWIGRFTISAYVSTLYETLSILFFAHMQVYNVIYAFFDIRK